MHTSIFLSFTYFEIITGSHKYLVNISLVVRWYHVNVPSDVARGTLYAFLCVCACPHARVWAPGVAQPECQLRWHQKGTPRPQYSSLPMQNTGRRSDRSVRSTHLKRSLPIPVLQMILGPNAKLLTRNTKAAQRWSCIYFSRPWVHVSLRDTVWVPAVPPDFKMPEFSIFFPVLSPRRVCLPWRKYASPASLTGDPFCCFRLQLGKLEKEKWRKESIIIS